MTAQDLGLGVSLWSTNVDRFIVLEGSVLTAAPVAAVFDDPSMKLGRVETA